MFKTIGIISRPRREVLAMVVPDLLKWLAERGVQAIYDEETASCLRKPERVRSREQLAKEAQLLLV